MQASTICRVIFILVIFSGSFNYSQGLIAQSDYDFLFEDARTYDENRFGRSIGQPLLFDVWAIGQVYSNTGQIYYPMLVNYNVEDKVWEARNGNKLIALDPDFFWCVIFNKNDNPFLDFPVGDQLLFLKGMLEDDENEYVLMLYNGTKLKLMKKFEVSKSKQSVSNETVFSFLRFLHRSSYVLRVENENESLRTLNRNKIIELLDKPKKDIEKILAEIGEELSSEADWVKALQLIEEQLFAAY